VLDAGLHHTQLSRKRSGLGRRVVRWYAELGDVRVGKDDLVRRLLKLCEDLLGQTNTAQLLDAFKERGKVDQGEAYGLLRQLHTREGMLKLLPHLEVPKVLGTVSLEAYHHVEEPCDQPREADLLLTAIVLCKRRDELAVRVAKKGKSLVVLDLIKFAGKSA